MVNIKNIGRTRARILASKGLRRPKDVLNMSKKIRSEIEQIRGWGPQLLENIFEEIKKVEGRPVTTPPKRRDDEPLEGERAED